MYCQVRVLTPGDGDVSIPFVALETFLFSLFVYGLTGLADGVGSGKFWCFLALLTFTNLAARAFAMFSCAFSPNGTSGLPLPCSLSNCSTPTCLRTLVMLLYACSAVRVPVDE